MFEQVKGRGLRPVQVVQDYRQPIVRPRPRAPPPVDAKSRCRDWSSIGWLDRRYRGELGRIRASEPSRKAGRSGSERRPTNVRRPPCAPRANLGDGKEGASLDNGRHEPWSTWAAGAPAAVATSLLLPIPPPPRPRAARCRPRASYHGELDPPPGHCRLATGSPVEAAVAFGGRWPRTTGRGTLDLTTAWCPRAARGCPRGNGRGRDAWTPSCASTRRRQPAGVSSATPRCGAGRGGHRPDRGAVQVAGGDATTCSCHLQTPTIPTSLQDPLGADRCPHDSRSWGTRTTERDVAKSDEDGAAGGAGPDLQ